MMSYALWDVRTTNIINAFDNQRDALELVLSGIELNGPEDTDTLILNAEDEEGNVTFIAQGRKLAEMAKREFAAQPLTT